MHDRKKLSKITEELSMFFFSIGGDDQYFRIQLLPEKAIITFESTYDVRYAHKLETMDKLLNSERDDGVEDVYWELAGTGDPGESTQLLLVGLMIDEAEVEVEPSRVYIKMTKKLAPQK